MKHGIDVILIIAEHVNGINQIDVIQNQYIQNRIILKNIKYNTSININSKHNK